MAYTLVTRRLLPGSLDPLSNYELKVNDSDRPLPHDQLLEQVQGANALICLPGDLVDAEVIEAGSALSVIATVSVGFDHIDLSAASRSGIPVCHTPDVLDEATADLALGLMIAAARRMGEAERDLRSLSWQGWAVDQYLGLELNGATLGIVGFGRIGKAVARRALGFGMQVVHHSRHPSGEPGYFADLDQMLSISDVVSLHVPLTEQTRHLIDARRLALMKDTAVLVNTSRGAVVDEEALADALIEGKIFAAGIDVYEQEPRVHPKLLSAPRAVLLPHIGSATTAARTAMASRAVADVKAVLEGRRPVYLLNPEVFAGGGRQETPDK